MPEKANCVICELPEQPTERGSARDRYRMTCQRCGSYETDEAADLILQQLSAEERPVVSHWVYEQNSLGVVPALIRAEETPSIRTRRRYSYAERTRLLLTYLAEKTTSPGQEVDTGSSRLQAALQQFDLRYIYSIVQHLFSEKLLILKQPFGLPARMAGTSSNVELTPRGIMQVEEWGRSYAASRQGFVAMWFDASTNDAWFNGFDPGIRNAGYLPYRIDKTDYIGGVSDEIMAQIRQSRFVVADYTGQRNGVYFEAGFAAGLGLRVIPTCRADEVEKLHFDIKHLNTLLWNTPAELVDGLNRRIRAVVGVGPHATDLR
jgi:hypothetical protein